MPRELWNEGRVVGYSAYEMYVKHALETDPNHEPASEKQWLASMMAMGSSMLLKVEEDDIDGLHYRDIQFPESSRLCAANTILASLFLGEGAVSEDSPWCTKVTSYGPLIQNDGTASPKGTVGPTGTIPPSDLKNANTQTYVEIRTLKPSATVYHINDDGSYSEVSYTFPEDDALAGDDEPLTDDEKTLLKNIYHRLIATYGGRSIIGAIFAMNAMPSYHSLPFTTFIGTGTSIADGVENFLRIYKTLIAPTWVVSDTDEVDDVKYANLDGKIGAAGTIGVTVCFDDAAVDIVYHTTMEKYIKEPVTEYMKIIDGIVIQPGTWVTNPNNPPKKDFTPTLSEYPRLRLGFCDRVNYAFYLLLVGFTNRTVVDGVTGFSTAVNTSAPDDGDFLGPWQFPWSNKIVFSVPAAYISYFVNNKYTREMESGTNAITVKSDVVLDYKHDYDENYNSAYYAENDTGATLSVNVTDVNISGEDAAVLASYMHSHKFSNGGTAKLTKLPPALYGALIDNTGEKQFMPLDTVAPGSLKLYHGDGTDTSESYYKARTLETETAGTAAFLRKETATDENDTDISYVVYELNQNDVMVPVSDDYPISIYGALSSTEPIAPYFALQHIDGPDDSVYFPTVASRRMFGNLSNKFADDFKLASDQIKRLRNLGVNDSLYSQIEDDKEKQGKYYYVLIGPKQGDTGDKSSGYYTLVPVRTVDGHIDFTLKFEYSYMDVAWLTGSSTKANDGSERNLQYLGSWWNDEHHDVIEDHQNIKAYVDEKLSRVGAYTVIKDPSRRVPAGDWEDAYSAISLQGIVDSIRNAGGPEIDISNVVEDYQSKKLSELASLCRLHDMKTGEPIMYTDEYGKKQYGRLYECNVMTAESVAKALGGTEDAPTIDYTKLEVGVQFNTAINEQNEDKTYMISIPQQYQRTDGPLATVGISGNHQTMALSVADADGMPYNLFGMAETVRYDDLEDENLHWNDLVESLAGDKSIDLLGDILKEFRTHLKSSGDNYIELKNGVRLYISTSEPTGSIPNGSIGIGW